MENRAKQDGIRSWCQLIKQHETDGNKNVRIKKLESVINILFHRHYKGGLTKWIQDYEDALTELVILVPLDLAGCMVHFKYRLPISDECESLKGYSLT